MDGAVTPLITEAQVAKMLGLSVQEVARSRTLYGLPYFELGPKKFRYKLADVLAWLETRKKTHVHPR